MDLQTYLKLFKAGKPVAKGTVTGLIGRILRGKDAADFETTTNDIQKNGDGSAFRLKGRVQPNRPLVLLVDSDTVGEIIGISNNTYSMLHLVGYDPNDIVDHYKNGLDFKFVVFEDNGSSLATLGTWDNMVNLAQTLYPDLAPLFERHRQNLKRHSFDQIVKMSGVNEWKQAKFGEPEYMDEYKLLRSDQGLAAVRRFFFDTLHLRKLYAGDGWTYNAAGQRGVPEYVVPTCPLTELGKHIVIDLPKLQLPRASVGSSRKVSTREWPVPDFFKPQKADDWGYGPNHDKLLDAAEAWRKKHGIKAAATDAPKIIVLDIDSQKDFTIPGAPLYVGGRSQTGAVDDTVRFTEFKYRNLGRITSIANTLDTHPAFAIHTRSFWFGPNDSHVAPFTDIPLADIEAGRSRPNPMVASMLGVSPVWLDNQVRHYASELLKAGKYVLTVWTTHCVLGSDGYALNGLTQEVRMFHAYVRGAMNDPEIKGGHPLTENYGIMSPEVLTRWDGHVMAQKNTRFLEQLLKFDVAVIAGQAASHCVKSSIDQILAYITATDPKLAQKVYLLEDCMSAVVTPFHDYTAEAEAALKRFADAGMHVVKSTTPMEDWPGINLG